jgi:hypothetical protein
MTPALTVRLSDVVPRPPRRLYLPGVPCPRCGRRHRGWRTVVECRFGPLLWSMGTAPFSGPAWCSVSWCRPQTTVIIYDNEAEALKAKALIDRLACGGRCCRRHDVVRLP